MKLDIDGSGVLAAVTGLVGALLYVFRIAHRVGRMEEKVDGMMRMVERQESRTDEMLLHLRNGRK